MVHPASVLSSFLSKEIPLFTLAWLMVDTHVEHLSEVLAANM